MFKREQFSQYVTSIDNTQRDRLVRIFFPSETLNSFNSHLFMEINNAHRKQDMAHDMVLVGRFKGFVNVFGSYENYNF